MEENQINNVNKDIIDEKANVMVGVLSYLGLLWIVAYFCRQKGESAEYENNHLRQGFGILLAIVLINIASVIGSFVPFLPFIFGIMNLVLIVFAIMGIINAAGKKIAKLPVIGDLCDQIGSFIK